MHFVCLNAAVVSGGIVEHGPKYDVSRCTTAASRSGGVHDDDFMQALIFYKQIPHVGKITDAAVNVYYNYI